MCCAKRKCSTIVFNVNNYTNVAPIVTIMSAAMNFSDNHIHCAYNIKT